MRKIFGNNKIFISAIVSFSLLFFALVGVGDVQAINCSVPQKGTGTCQLTAWGTGCGGGVLGIPTLGAPICTGAGINEGVCCIDADFPACTTITTAECITASKCPTAKDSVPWMDANGSCTSGKVCCKPKPAAPSDAPACDTIANINAKTGRCQDTKCAEGKSISSPNPPCPPATQYCCKPDAGGTTKFNYCATIPTGETNKNAIGGICAEKCGDTTPQDVSGQLLNNECITTPNTKLCCKAADATAADQTPGQTSAATASDVPEEAGPFFKALAWLISAVIWLFGALLLGVVECIVKVSQFNRIVNSYFVVQGWIVLRDLVNMFFVLGLLFIAFVTVLKIEKYQWQKLLPKLLIMAVVVNFSRTICGLMIDFFQVMMFTFVNAYKDIAGENLYKGLGLRDMWDPGTAGAEMGSTALLLGRLLGLIYVIVALIVCIIFLVILVFRIVMLWVLVVFSPLAFFSASFKGISGKVGSYWDQWFKQFIEYCMVGPLLAFFLWLSILSLGSDYTTQYSQEMSPEASVGQTSLAVTNNKAGRLDYVMKFVIGILMLVVGLKFTADTKVIGSSMAGKAASKIQGAAYAGAARLAKASKEYVGEPLASRAYRGDLGWMGKQLAPQTWRDRGTLIKGGITGLIAGEPGRSREAQEQVLKKKTEAYDRSKKFISPKALDKLFHKSAKDGDYRTMDYAIQGLSEVGALTAEHGMIVQSGGFNDNYLKDKDLQKEYEKKISKKNKANGGSDFVSSDYEFDEETGIPLPKGRFKREIETNSKDKRGVMEDRLDSGLYGNAGTINNPNFGKLSSNEQLGIIKVSVESAMGQLVGADQNSTTDLQSSAIHKNLGSRGEFYLGDDDKKKEMLKDETFIPKVFRYKKDDESPTAYKEAAVKFYTDTNGVKPEFKKQFEALAAKSRREHEIDPSVPDLITSLNNNIARSRSRIEAGSGKVTEAGLGLKIDDAGVDPALRGYLNSEAPEYKGRKGDTQKGPSPEEIAEAERKRAEAERQRVEEEQRKASEAAAAAEAERTAREEAAEEASKASNRFYQPDEAQPGDIGYVPPAPPPPPPQPHAPSAIPFDPGTFQSPPGQAAPAAPAPAAPATPAAPAAPAAPAQPAAAPTQNDIVVNQAVNMAVTMVNNSINKFTDPGVTSNTDLGQAFGAIVRNFNTSIADLEKSTGGKLSSEIADLKKQMSDIGSKFYDPSNPNAVARKSDAEAGFDSLRKKLDNLKKSNS